MTIRTFAELLKEARLAADLSQSALARQAGLTGSYISLLESRRRPPPTDRVIRALARALGTRASPLLEAAALERSPPTVRRRLERMRKERGRVQKSRDRLLTTTLFHLARGPRVIQPMAEFLDLPTDQQALLGRLLGRVRKVRDLDEVESRTDTLLEDATPEERDALMRVLPRVLRDDARTPAGSGAQPPAVAPETDVPVLARPGVRASATDRRPVPPGVWREALYFWRAPGDEAHPRIEAGDLLLVDPARVPAEGDLVVIEVEGRARIGAFARRGAEVLLVFPRPELPPVRLAPDAFHPLGVVIEIRRELS